MIPRTFPSVEENNKRLMVVYPLQSVAGLQAWIDYIPVKSLGENPAFENTYAINGYIPTKIITSLIGLQAFKDYIPVYEDPSYATAWSTNSNGYIPIAFTPSLFLDFTSSNTLDPRITFTRGSNATYFDASGVLQTAANNVPRFDYDPVTLAAKGLLIEEQRTNYIRNNTMQGAVAGTPGTLPTNWSVSGLGTLVQQVVGTGTSNGISYVDVRFSGTTSTTSVSLRFEPNNIITAVNGQTWTHSFWTAMVGGSTANISQAASNANLYGSSGVFVGSMIFLGAAVNTTGTLTRVGGSGTIAVATTAYIQPQIYLTFASGAAIDITLRIGLPQLELGAFATSVIPTTGSQATRSADVAVMTGTNFSSWYRQDEGTLFGEWTSFMPNGTSPGSTYAVGFTNNLSSSSAVQLSIQNRAVANQIRVWQSTVGGGLDDYITLIAGTPQGKAAAAYGGGANVSGSGNGAAVKTMANPITATSFNTLAIGLFTTAASETGSNYLNGHIQRISYYPRRLSNAELQAITT